MSTKTEIRDEVLAHQFSPSAYSARIEKWIDQGNRRIYRDADIRINSTTSTVNTIVGTSTYSLPTDFNKIISLRNTSLAPNDNLEDIRDIRLYDELDAQSGTPNQYVIDGSNIVVYPTPNAVQTLVLRYWKGPTDLGATEAPAWSSDYHYLLEEYALYKAFLSEHDREMADIHKQIFEQDIVKLADELQNDAETQPRQIQGAWPLGY